jgi:hypothetical protein
MDINFNSSFLEELVFNIENAEIYKIQPRLTKQMFELQSDPRLMDNLSGGKGTYIVRALLNYLGVYEHQILKWRLENKWVQYQLLNYYIPNVMAPTISLSVILNEDNGANKVKAMCANGYFLKYTLGDSSGRTNRFDRTAELDAVMNSYPNRYDNKEEWILQEKLDLNEEFRIHSFGRDLIYGLCFRINGHASDGSAVQEFVKSILQRLPDGILQGSLIGWDIGITRDNHIYVIEANFTGFHQEYERGFQTSGYFGDGQYGPIICAWLNNYFKISYNISIGAVEQSLLVNDTFFNEFIDYNTIFSEVSLEPVIKNHDRKDIAAIFYLGNHINMQRIKLLKYFQVTNLANWCFVIVHDDVVLDIKELVAGFKNIKVLIEQKLFTKKQFLLIQDLDFNTRKLEVCHQALNLINETVHVIV